MIVSNMKQLSSNLRNAHAGLFFRSIAHFSSLYAKQKQRLYSRSKDSQGENLSRRELKVGKWELNKAQLTVKGKTSQVHVISKKEAQWQCCIWKCVNQYELPKVHFHYAVPLSSPLQLRAYSWSSSTNISHLKQKPDWKLWTLVEKYHYFPLHIQIKVCVSMEISYRQRDKNSFGFAKCFKAAGVLQWQVCSGGRHVIKHIFVLFFQSTHSWQAEWQQTSIK